MIGAQAAQAPALTQTVTQTQPDLMGCAAAAASRHLRTLGGGGGNSLLAALAVATRASSMLDEGSAQVVFLKRRRPRVLQELVRPAVGINGDGSMTCKLAGAQLSVARLPEERPLGILPRACQRPQADTISDFCKESVRPLDTRTQQVHNCCHAIVLGCGKESSSAASGWMMLRRSSQTWQRYSHSADRLRTPAPPSPSLS